MVGILRYSSIEIMTTWKKADDGQFCIFTVLINVISQMYKTLQLFTTIFTLNTNKFTSIKVIKNTYVQTQKLLKMLSALQLELY
jgi:hypothetical protein